MKERELEAFLYSAMSAERGVVIKTNDPATLRSKLYATRRKYQREGDRSFDDLSFRLVHDTDDELIILKGGSDGPEE